jgi:hypothetical protein
MTPVLADSPASRVRDAVGAPVEERRQGAPAVTKRYSGGSARMWEQSASCDLPQRECSRRSSCCRSQAGAELGTDAAADGSSAPLTAGAVQPEQRMPGHLKCHSNQESRS